MKNTRSDFGGREAYADIAGWIRSQQGDNSETMERLRRNLRRARSEALTPRQAQLLVLYYDRGKTVRGIAQELGVSPSTVSRTLSRARRRLRRCLQYGF